MIRAWEKEWNNGGAPTIPIGSSGVGGRRGDGAQTRRERKVSSNGQISLGLDCTGLEWTKHEVASCMCVPMQDLAGESD